METNDLPGERRTMPENPRVFVSYAWSSQEHETRVLEFAARLRSSGVDAILDKTHLRTGQDLYVFMESMVTDPSIKKVLIICDQTYAEKADKRRGGVGAESQIISPEVYAKADQTKFIPIVMERRDGEACLPTYLKSRLYFDFCSPQRFEEAYESLVRDIYGKPLHRPAPLGNAPSFVEEPDEHPVATRFAAQRVRAAVEEGRANASKLLKAYLAEFVTSIGGYTLNNMPAVQVDDAVLGAIADFRRARDEFVETVHFVASQSELPLGEPLHECFEEASKYSCAAKGAGSWNPLQFDHHRFILWELFLHSISILIAQRRAADVTWLLNEEFMFYEDGGGRRYGSFLEIRKYLKTLDEFRKSRLGLNRMSVTADTIKERATTHAVSFESLMETDFVLFLFTVLAAEGGRWIMWYPMTLMYASHGAFPLFQRAEAKRHFVFLAQLLGVKDKTDLVERFNKGNTAGSLNGYVPLGHSVFLPSISELANFAKLDTR